MRKRKRKKQGRRRRERGKKRKSLRSSRKDKDQFLVKVIDNTIKEIQKGIDQDLEIIKKKNQERDIDLILEINPRDKKIKNLLNMIKETILVIIDIVKIDTEEKIPEIETKKEININQKETDPCQVLLNPPAPLSYLNDRISCCLIS